jgi:hypothetical protein
MGTVTRGSSILVKISMSNSKGNTMAKGMACPNVVAYTRNVN